MKHLRSLYSSLKFWWRLCPLRYRGQGQVSLLFEYDDLNIEIKSLFPKDLFVEPLKYTPPMLPNQQLSVSMSGRITYEGNAPGLVYIVLPKDKL